MWTWVRSSAGRSQFRTTPGSNKLLGLCLSRVANVHVPDRARLRRCRAFAGGSDTLPEGEDPQSDDGCMFRAGASSRNLPATVVLLRPSSRKFCLTARGPYSNGTAPSDTGALAKRVPIRG